MHSFCQELGSYHQGRTLRQLEFLHDCYYGLGGRQRRHDMVASHTYGATAASSIGPQTKSVRRFRSGNTVCHIFAAPTSATDVYVQGHHN